MKSLRLTRPLLALGIALSCLIAPLVGHAQCDPRRFTSIDFPGVADTFVTGLNNLGQVVGSYQSGSYDKSFVWSRGKFLNLPTSSKVLGSDANDINDLGQVVGLQISSDFVQSGFVYDWIFSVPFNNPNAVFSLTFPRSINNWGQIAGFFVDANSSTNGFVYQRGTFTTVKVPGAVSTSINSLNDLGQLAGSYVASLPNGSFATRAFVYSKGAFTPLSVPGAITFSVATSINNLGQVVGYYLGSDFTTHGFLYSRGRYTTFDTPVAGFLGTYPGGINDWGQISGEYVDSSSRTHGFLLDGIDN